MRAITDPYLIQNAALQSSAATIGGIRAIRMEYLHFFTDNLHSVL
jgi:hypothetical protein